MKNQSVSIMQMFNWPYSPFSGACEVSSEPWLFNLTVQTNQYYLQPDVSVDLAESLTQTSFKPLKRFH